MATAPSATQIAVLVAVVKQLFATSFIGFAIATTLYGISVLQAYLYYRNYPNDHPALKVTVALLWVLDTLCTIFVAHSLYNYFVLNFGKIPTVDLIIPWSFTTEKFLVTLITFVAQAFYTRTIWKVSGSIIISASVGMLAVATFALGIVTTVYLYRTPLASFVSSRPAKIISGIGAGGWVAGQTFGTDKVLDTLIPYAVSRGVLTAATQFLFLTLNLAVPHPTYWLPFHQAVGKLYVNSVFATLNVRSTFQGVENKQATLSFADVPTGTVMTQTGTGTGTGTGSNTKSAPSDKHLRPLVFSTVSQSGGSVELSETRSRGALAEKEAGNDV
ncbi:hypothetical protein MVEN_01293000 [Mycena venus]|uniref:DUF6534 domain-containing protein n=1 Tax=Mycena venus TaxID=2733690 RepID=A0A8H6XX96_9AGAR|nr:hypothetical protein MVEN_01293000 [Mycena venus]